MSNQTMSIDFLLCAAFVCVCESRYLNYRSMFRSDITWTLFNKLHEQLLSRTRNKNLISFRYEINGINRNDCEYTWNFIGYRQAKPGKNRLQYKHLIWKIHFSHYQHTNQTNYDERFLLYFCFFILLVVPFFFAVHNAVCLMAFSVVFWWELRTTLEISNRKKQRGRGREWKMVCVCVGHRQAKTILRYTRSEQFLSFLCVPFSVYTHYTYRKAKCFFGFQQRMREKSLAQ